VILLHQFHCFKLSILGVAFAVFGQSGPDQSKLLDVNLIANGTAEASATSWMPIGATPLFITKLYGTPGWPDSRDPGPPARGAKFFYGGNTPAAQGHQEIELGSLTPIAGAGRLRFVISAYLGGVADETDAARLTLRFLDARHAVLHKVILLGPTPQARHKQTGLHLRSKDGAVPAGTAFADVELTLLRTDGNSNDGYADNLELRFVLSPTQ
jgi:hypothetical protein